MHTDEHNAQPAPQDERISQIRLLSWRALLDAIKQEGLQAGNSPYFIALFDELNRRETLAQSSTTGQPWSAPAYDGNPALPLPPDPSITHDQIRARAMHIVGRMREAVERGRAVRTPEEIAILRANDLIRLDELRTQRGRHLPSHIVIISPDDSWTWHAETPYGKIGGYIGLVELMIAIVNRYEKERFVAAEQRGMRPMWFGVDVADLERDTTVFIMPHHAESGGPVAYVPAQARKCRRCESGETHTLDQHIAELDAAGVLPYEPLRMEPLFKQESVEPVGYVGDPPQFTGPTISAPFIGLHDLLVQLELCGVSFSAKLVETMIEHAHGTKKEPLFLSRTLGNLRQLVAMLRSSPPFAKRWEVEGLKSQTGPRDMSTIDEALAETTEQFLDGFSEEQQTGEATPEQRAAIAEALRKLGETPIPPIQSPPPDFAGAIEDCDPEARSVAERLADELRALDERLAEVDDQARKDADDPHEHL